MKTEGYTFLEAVQALKDGKCAGIKHARWVPICIISLNSSAFCVWPNGDAYDGTKADQLLSSDWQLINPVPEKRTVKGWVNIYPGHAGGGLIGSVAHPTMEAALTGRQGLATLGDPHYIEHEYEVTE